MGVQYRILGPVEVEIDGEPVALVRQQARHLLALLLLDAGRAIPERRLIDLLWPEDPPVNARAVLQTTVSRLRASVPGLALVRRGDGYAADVDPETVDAQRFRCLLDDALRATDPHRRAGLAGEALRLWRGPALADVGTDLSRERACLGLRELYQNALDVRVGADLELGRHREIVGELTELVALDPLNERLVGQLMVALYRSGRRGDALNVYRQTKQAIAEHLGLDPGPDLEQLELAVLRDDPCLEPNPTVPAGAAPAGPTVAVPAQLPAAVTDLIGRHAEWSRLDQFRADADAGATAGIVVVTGPPGVGKTALAVRWGHDVAARFPDGQLYVNLRGYAQREAVSPIGALVGFLVALGMERERVPLDEDEAAAAYRTRLDGRRVLIVLDNAATADQARPLLPGAATCLTVVTSRDSLPGLVAREGATVVDLAALTATDAVTLLARTVGAARADAEPEALAELARACGNLPLALRIAAAQLVDDRHQSIADHVRRIAAVTALGTLLIAGDPDTAVRAAFDRSYERLGAAARRVFRRLGVVALPDAATGSISALAGLDEPATVALLERLVQAHLVEYDSSARYRVHDLLHQYAQERLHAEEPDAGRTAGRRLVAYLLDRADAAASQLYPQMLRLPGRTAAFAFDSRADALDWLAAELDTLVAVVTHSAEQDDGAAAATMLSDRLRGYFWLSSRTVEWLTVAEAALRAATRAGDVHGQCASELSLGMAALCTSRYPTAADHLHRALEHARRAAWSEGEAAALSNLGSVDLELGHLESAAAHFRAAMRLNQRLGRAPAAATNRGNLAVVLQLQGRLREAALEFTGALEYQREANLLASQALNLSNLGLVQRDLGDYAQAEDLLRAALRADEETGNVQAQAADRARLASVLAGTQRLELARAEVMAAMELLVQIDDPSTECEAQGLLATIHSGLGDHDAALVAQTRAAALAEQIGSQSYRTLASLGLAETHLAAGDPGRAEPHALTALRLAKANGYLQYEGTAHTVVAAVALATGAFDDAARHAQAALELHRATGYRRQEERTLALLDELMAHFGQFESP